MASFADSLVAPLSVINALVVAVSRQKQDELRVRLHQLEKIWEEYNVYDTNQS
jgi:DNA-binding MurR/RpiR family transcriptional regulator